MKSVKERLYEIKTSCTHVGHLAAISKGVNYYDEGYIQGDADRKVLDKELIDMLIRELYTSRAYHLGITGLDSAEEIARKEIEGNTALIRGIDHTIKYVKEAMED